MLLSRGRKANGLNQQPVICCRVSTDPQWRNLDDQIDRLIHATNWHFTAIFDYIGHGNEVERWTEAANLAREHKVPIFAESLDRLMRSSEYSPSNQDAPLTEEDWERYHRVFDGVEIVFLDEASSRSHQTKRGQQAKGNRGGRPCKTKVGRPRGKPNVRQSILDKAKYMRKQGLSYQSIGKILGKPRQTIHYWIHDKK